MNDSDVIEDALIEAPAEPVVRHPSDVLADLVKALDDAKAVVAQWEAAEAAKLGHSSMIQSLKNEYQKSHDWFFSEVDKIANFF